MPTASPSPPDPDPEVAAVVVVTDAEVGTVVVVDGRSVVTVPLGIVVTAGSVGVSPSVTDPSVAPSTPVASSDDGGAAGSAVGSITGISSTCAPSPSMTTVHSATSAPWSSITGVPSTIRPASSSGTPPAVPDST